ncbi:MAG: DNA gyrase inhibitor YacG [Rhodospirillales bacterium 20-60-12]|nr:MAG: DNA gyrase inhibitor YacG [Rhodospirillales bacterium 20-60-12]HQT67954.1 DNA gyrase inhibitor YacG [Acetobacteraceae bacterium]HQU02203.1 DNA gyrase inhibitor YacG [Acetobacteraceae bacterium]
MESKCPICRKPSLPAHKPFCSARCRQIDLGRWFTEDYRLPDHSLPDPDDEDGQE